jgi:hypothetical protein
MSGGVRGGAGDDPAYSIEPDVMQKQISRLRFAALEMTALPGFARIISSHKTEVIRIANPEYVLYN